MIQTQYTTINGIKLFVRTAGQGQNAILMIHGSGMSSEYFMPQLQNEKLLEKNILMAIDLPGHGSSAWLSETPQAYWPDRLALLIEPLLKIHNIRNYILVGLSLGTCIIGEIRDPLPGCKGIILASPCIVNDQHLPSSVITASYKTHVIVTPNPEEQELKEYAYHYEDNKEIAERYIQDYKNTDPAFREQLGQMMASAGWSDQLENICQWSVPVCVLFGADDTLLNKNYLDGYEPLWKGNPFIIQGAGHMLSLDHSSEFNEILLQFSKEVLDNSFADTKSH